mgnify:CR=1 FL=1
MDRLHPSRLAALPGDVARPGYDRSALEAGIVHLGVGAFQRAHMAAATDAAIAAGRTSRTALSVKLPLYVMYWTAVVDEAGDLILRPAALDQQRLPR